MIKLPQGKSIRDYILPVNYRALHYIAAKLNMRWPQFQLAIGNSNPKTFPANKQIRGTKALCLTYLCALHGFDVKDLLVESEDVVSISEAVRITGITKHATARYLRDIGIQPLTVKPIYIRKSDLAVMMSTSLQPLLQLMQACPLRVWRKEKRLLLRQAKNVLGIDSRRITAIEAGGDLMPGELTVLRRHLGTREARKLLNWLKIVKSTRPLKKKGALRRPAQFRGGPS